MVQQTKKKYPYINTGTRQGVGRSTRVPGSICMSLGTSVVGGHSAAAVQAREDDTRNGTASTQGQGAPTAPRRAAAARPAVEAPSALEASAARAPAALAARALGAPADSEYLLGLEAAAAVRRGGGPRGTCRRRRGARRP
jgi:hypothetical protein